MPQVRINRELNSNIYFLTFTVHNWYYLLDRHERWTILLNSLKYFQKEKQLRVYSWVFMINHIHIIIGSPNVIGFIRDFKKYTSKQVKHNLAIYEPALLKLFLNGDGNYYFWKRGNMPELIRTEKFFQQKVHYIENNPVKRCYVTDPKHWLHSSAHPRKLLPLEKDVY